MIGALTPQAYIRELRLLYLICAFASLFLFLAYHHLVPTIRLSGAVLPTQPHLHFGFVLAICLFFWSLIGFARSFSAPLPTSNRFLTEVAFFSASSLLLGYTWQWQEMRSLARPPLLNTAAPADVLGELWSIYQQQSDSLAALSQLGLAYAVVGLILLAAAGRLYRLLSTEAVISRLCVVRLRVAAGLYGGLGVVLVLTSVWLCSVVPDANSVIFLFPVLASTLLLWALWAAVAARLAVLTVWKAPSRLLLLPAAAISTAVMAAGWAAAMDGLRHARTWQKWTHDLWRAEDPRFPSRLPFHVLGWLFLLSGGGFLGVVVWLWRSAVSDKVEEKERLVSGREEVAVSG